MGLRGAGPGSSSAVAASSAPFFEGDDGGGAPVTFLPEGIDFNVGLNGGADDGEATLDSCDQPLSRVGGVTGRNKSTAEITRGLPP